MHAARWVPACLAAYELRHLVGWMTGAAPTQTVGGAGSLQAWLAALLAIGAVLVLREAGRGLATQLPRPRWSGSLLRTWLGCSLGILGALCCAHLIATTADGGRGLDGSSLLVGFQSWSVALAALVAGLALAVSLTAARWVVATVSRRRRQRTRSAVASTLAARRAPTGARLRTPTPLLGGWSDRGPPRGAALTAA